LKAEGGWYAVLRVPSKLPDGELAVNLLTKQNVYVHPGHFYDFTTEGPLIISLITPEQEFRESIGQLISAI